MSFFSDFFSSKAKKLSTPVDLSVLKTDLHSHYIPGIDDGSKSLEESLKLISGMKALGYQKVITTPHIMSDYYKNTSEIILGGLENVRKALAENHVDIEIDAAAEYYVDYEFTEKIKSKNILTLSQNYVLIEISFLNPPDSLEDTIFNLNIAGYKPILAHPERYPYWHHDLEKYQRIKDMGALLQLNMLSLTHYYSESVKKTAEKLVDKGMIDLLGSDMHNERHLETVTKQVVYEPYLLKLIESGRLRNNAL